MNRYIITECPACTTRFQVTAGQLKLAGGKVRCGACLEVFNAEVYRCDDIPDPVAEALSDPSSDAAISAPETHHDPLFEALDIPTFISADDSSAAHRSEPHHQADHQHTDLTTGQNADEDQSDDLAPDERLAERLNNSPDDEAELTGLEQPVQALIDDKEPVSSESAEPPTTTDHTWHDPLAASVAETLQQAQQQAAQPAASQHSAPPAPETSPTQPDPEQTRPFTAIRAEPVMIRSTQQARHLNLSGLALVLMALILLAGQVFWFNRQPLSALPELAPAYQTACQHLPCQLRPVIDLQQIDTRQLVVQEHLQYQGALTVSLLLENIAPNAQPYPAVSLSFTDRKGQLISQRLFQPQDYLNNRTLNLQQMPARQMVQISFDILDPGRRAVSYEAGLEVPDLAASVSDGDWRSILFGRLL